MELYAGRYGDLPGIMMKGMELFMVNEMGRIL